MKNIFLLLTLLLFISPIYSQEKTLPTKDGSIIILKDSNNFYFHENCGWCPVGCEYGKGKYVIQKNKLELQFQRKPIEKSHYQIQYDSINNDSTFTIQVQVFEDSIYGLIGANVFYNIDGYNSGTSTDVNGKGKLVLKKNVKYDTLYVQYLGMSNFAIPITKRNQSIKIYPETITFWEIYNIKKVYRLNKWRNYWEEVNEN